MQSRHLHFSKKLFEINSNWTSIQNMEGWAHYRIVSRRRSPKGKLELEMMAVCDRAIRVWVPRAVLRDSAHWRPGWIEPSLDRILLCD
ncbi:MAG: TIGR02450 family Trp-rich protein [Chitinophagaceae bacterium]|nr:TIGR02450 family Trp-rich protein [Oligoflexus sp.]